MGIRLCSQSIVIGEEILERMNKLKDIIKDTYQDIKCESEYYNVPWDHVEFTPNLSRIN